MYVPRHFEEKRPEILHGLIREYPLGSLVTVTAEGLDANHVPFEIDPDPAPLGTLRCHVARSNPVWREFDPGVDAMVVFRGPEAYVSPGLYPSKRETGKVVPTWNYVVVQAHGPLRVIEDRDWLRALVARLTVEHEGARSEPWKITDAPAEFVDAMLRAIVGLEIPLRRLTGKWKLSQNRPLGDRQGVIERLARERGPRGAALAERMREALAPERPPR